MAFSFSVELLNMKVRRKSVPVELREPHIEVPSEGYSDQAK